MQRENERASTEALERERKASERASRGFRKRKDSSRKSVFWDDRKGKDISINN